MVRDKFRAYLN